MLLKLAMTNRVTVILNEVKNRIVTKCKPTAEILHFVQNELVDCNNGITAGEKGEMTARRATARCRCYIVFIIGSAVEGFKMTKILIIRMNVFLTFLNT